MTESGASRVVEVTGLATPAGWSRAEQRAAAEGLLDAYGPVTRLCRQCGSSGHGQPRVPGERRVSISYAEGLVLVAVADRAVGVDVEQDGPAPEGYPDRRAWAVAEALLKVSGEGLYGAAASVEAWSAELDLPAPYVGAVALVGTDPAEVSLRWAGAGAPCVRATE